MSVLSSQKRAATSKWKIDADMLADLGRGRVFTKFGRRGVPHLRRVWLSADQRRICYQQRSTASVSAAGTHQYQQRRRAFGSGDAATADAATADDDDDAWEDGAQEAPGVFRTRTGMTAMSSSSLIRGRASPGDDKAAPSPTWSERAKASQRRPGGGAGNDAASSAAPIEPASKGPGGARAAAAVGGAFAAVFAGAGVTSRAKQKSVGPLKSIRVADIVDVVVGRDGTDVMRRGNVAAFKDPLCFSIITTKRSLDLEAHNPEDVELWVHFLQRCKEANWKTMRAQQLGQWREKRADRDSQNVDFWRGYALQHWTTRRVQVQRRIRTVWVQGIPGCIRTWAWPKIIGNGLEVSIGIFDSFVHLAHVNHGDSRGFIGQESNLAMIREDLKRTFPELQFFHADETGTRRPGIETHLRDHHLLKSTLRIFLQAYLLYRPDIGYVRGFSRIAAMLLLFMDFYMAFRCFANMMHTHFFMAFARLQPVQMSWRFDMLQAALEQEEPALWTHFQYLGISFDQFLIEWAMSLFTCILPLDVAARVWDLYFLDGEIVVYQVAFAILRYHSVKLCRASFEACLRLLTDASVTEWNEAEFWAIVGDVRGEGSSFNPSVEHQRLAETAARRRTKQREKRRRPRMLLRMARLRVLGRSRAGTRRKRRAAPIFDAVEFHSMLRHHTQNAPSGGGEKRMLARGSIMLPPGGVAGAERAAEAEAVLRTALVLPQPASAEGPGYRVRFPQLFIPSSEQILRSVAPQGFFRGHMARASDSGLPSLPEGKALVHGDDDRLPPVAELIDDSPHTLDAGHRLSVGSDQSSALSLDLALVSTPEDVVALEAVAAVLRDDDDDEEEGEI